MVKCAFCGKNKGEIPIQDEETLQELLICESCDELLFFKIPDKVKKIKGYKEMTIQQLENKIDEILKPQKEEVELTIQKLQEETAIDNLIDCQIEDMIALRHGTEI